MAETADQLNQRLESLNESMSLLVRLFTDTLRQQSVTERNADAIKFFEHLELCRQEVAQVRSEAHTERAQIVSAVNDLAERMLAMEQRLDDVLTEREAET